jgi:uncharacterized tellurite resistance protein B-like protein
MISGIRRFLDQFAAHPGALAPDDHRLAAAALLFHVIAIDGTISDAERQKLRELLARRFALAANDTDELIAAARSVESEAVDLYGFTSVLKRHLNEADREKIVEMMWELVFADGEVHEFEDNLVWRVAELLGVSSQARIRLKQAVRNASGQ